VSAVLHAVRVWGEMVKFSHSVFALPFALMAAFLAGRNIEGRHWPHAGQLALIVACMVAARSAAMTFNRIVDARIDARNPRTASRPLPTGRISTTAAWTMLGVACFAFVLGCLGFRLIYDNSWPVALSVPVLGYLCAYSLTKRFTRWSHFVLGSGIALSPIAAWIAIDPAGVGLEAVLLVVAVACWIAGFDIIYACLDIDFDRREGLHSLPARIGPRAALLIARGCHAVTIAAWVSLGVFANLGVVYAAGVGLAAILLIVENSLVRPGDYARVNLAFFTVNGVVGVLLATATIIDVLT
jgi:4-hydroxybenzoate polyprenyltransferase